MLITDYERIAQAIRFLEKNHRAQPKLAVVAAHVGLSECHFQRLFQRWAGISPKRFLQCLTAAHAQSLLMQSGSLLEVTFEAGLSSPSRLHNLFVKLHAVTPAQWRGRGNGVTIRYGFHESPFGTCLLAMTEKGICHLSFVDGTKSQGLAALAVQWPDATRVEDSGETRPIAQRVFSRNPEQGAALPLWVRGSPFQVKVWQALLSIPPGALTSYGSVAAALGTPGASRAVGTAVARNAIAYLIPCHRVIRSTGALGDYRWDPVRKKALLAWESANPEAVSHRINSLKRNM